MKPTARGALAAVMTGVVAAVGAAAVAPAVAADTVPVPVPLNGVEQSLGVKAPKVAGELPLPLPGRQEGPWYVVGRTIPDRAAPQVPLSGGLPGADVRTPLPHMVGNGFEHLGLSAPAADLRTLTPGVSLDGPLGAPDPDHLGLPGLKQPQAAVLAPLVRAVPTANLEMGSEA
uniref:Secreted protein n=1 Tax=Streptomyces sp. NBC_01393 TaxID=2903851 RepID=A0AAU3HZ87_9ACTN